MDAVPRPPAFADILDAAERLRAPALVTPLLESPLLNERLGGRVLVKAEPLQRTGSFKFRGAFNNIAHLDAEPCSRGVVTYSSGNHAQGVAAAAKMLGVAATIVMPDDAPRVKVESTRAWGARVVAYDRARESREARAREIAEATGAALVPPFDHPMTIAGQGTVGLEIAAALGEREIVPDAVLVPCGGGGLIAGVALALAETLPGVPVHAVEPEGYDDTRRSLASGERERAKDGAETFCDALRAPMPGALTFSLNRRLLAGGFAVSDAEVGRAMAVAFRDLKLVIEPGGAVALAAVLAGRLPVAGRTLVVVASGGNVDPETFAAALASEAQP